MLKSYEAIDENGQVKWLAEQPTVQSARLIVTVLEETTLPVNRLLPPTSIAGKGKTLGDLVSPIWDAEKANILVDHDLKLEELGGSEPQVQDIPRRRYDI